jgi:hypothetical protein
LKHSTVEVGTDARGRYRVRCPQIDQELCAPLMPGYQAIAPAWECMRHKFPRLSECYDCMHWITDIATQGAGAEVARVPVRRFCARA